MRAAVRVVVVFSSNELNCMFCFGIFGVYSGSGVNSGCDGCSLAHHFPHCSTQKV